ncbi:MAG: hypothetical protein P4L93_07685 [Coriobacteriia bacterium]|nr:hypothetical protein [Coriobacteriia bacterium]
MRNKWLIGGAVVVVVAIALVGGQLLMTRQPSTTLSPATLADLARSNPAGTSSTAPGTTEASASVSHGSDVAAPSQPAAAGAALKMLPAPPKATVGGFNTQYLKPGSRFSVTVEPYGLGPAQGSYQTVVVRIVSAKGLNGAKGAEKLVGTNALALIGPSRTGAFTTGGRVSAVLTLQPDPRGSVLMLSATGASGQ